MRPVSELKEDLMVSQSLGDIIDVLKTAALIQFHIFQTRQKPDENFIKEIEACFNLLFKKNITHPYLFERKMLPSAIVVVTSDEGFLGELNILLINVALDRRNDKEDELIVLGERGARYLEDMNERFTFFPGISDEVSYKEVVKIKDYLLTNYRKKIGRIIIVYPEFISLMVRRVEAFQFLPYLPQTTTLPTLKLSKAFDYLIEEFLIEPSLRMVLEVLIELWSGFKLLEIFWSSKQSEFGARIMHLEASTQELADLNKNLSLEYFRQVHALRDKVIREITASKLLLERKRQ